MTTLEKTDAATQPSAVRPASSQIEAAIAADKPVSIVRRPSTWRRLRMSAARHPRIVQLGVLSAIATGTAFFLLYSLFKGAWSENQDNFAILHTIFKMEIGRDSALAIDNNPQRVTTRSFTSIEPYVAKDNWEWRNRFGSTITYQKQDRWLIASCSPYSPLYLVCDLSEVP
ncbi:MAG: hypothetical protein WA947_04965 [Phormidesmis sp.]